MSGETSEFENTISNCDINNYKSALKHCSRHYNIEIYFTAASDHAAIKVMFFLSIFVLFSEQMPKDSWIKTHLLEIQNDIKYKVLFELISAICQKLTLI